MRVVCVFFAVIGACALAAGTGIELAAGQPADTAWGLLAAPFYVAGLGGVLSLRGPGRRVAAWLLAVGALFLVDVCLSNALYDVPGIRGSGWAWVVELAADAASNGTVVAAIGLVGLFPVGVPQTRAERVVLRGAAAAAVALPVLSMIVRRTPSTALFASQDQGIVSPLYVPAARFLASAVGALRLTFAAWVVLGLVLLCLRYRRGPAAERRLIRWLLAGLANAAVMFAVLVALAYLASGPLVTAAIFTLYGLTVFLALASLAAALSSGGMLGVDQAVSRTVAYRTLWLLIAVVYVTAATALGILASRHLPDWAAMLLAAAAALAFQPAQRRLERLADRWVFGRRLDGYQVITRFGALLESAPGPDDLLGRLAGAIREGLALRWVRVRLDLAVPADPAGPAGQAGQAGPAGAAAAGPVAAAGVALDSAAEPAHVVPLIQADQVLGQIECGPRRDGPLLDEDRRLLTHLAAQAATAVSNVRLAAALSDRLAVIERQAAELTASRARLVKSTDDERRRIQRDLHDGPQQDLVVLTLSLTLARERLRRGDPRADDTLAEVQADLTGLLARLREFAHEIHPPVLADQGLLVAIEAQASRLPLEVVIEADPELRGVRYPEQIETTAWYVISEAVTNAVKHGAAARLRICVAQRAGRLAVEVGDNGRGFDPAGPRGLGLASLADRMAIVHGELLVDSRPGHGTTLRAEIPLPASAVPAQAGAAAAAGMAAHG
jgi:signal transduction histidine kinase